MILSKIGKNLLGGGSFGIGSIVGINTMHYINAYEATQPVIDGNIDSLLPVKVINAPIDEEGSVLGKMITIIVLAGFSKIYYDSNNDSDNDSNNGIINYINNYISNYISNYINNYTLD